MFKAECSLAGAAMKWKEVELPAVFKLAMPADWFQITVCHLCVWGLLFNWPILAVWRGVRHLGPAGKRRIKLEDWSESLRKMNVLERFFKVAGCQGPRLMAQAAPRSHGNNSCDLYQHLRSKHRNHEVETRRSFQPLRSVLLMFRHRSILHVITYHKADIYW